MRTLFLLGTLVASLAACGSSPQPTIPTIQPPPRTTSTMPLSPVEFVKRDLEKANFVRQGGDWVRKSTHGNVHVTLNQKGSSVDVVARFVRPDGTAVCQIQALKMAFVGGVESLDDIATAADLINRHSCQAV